jgi:hypothetical protein
MNPKERRCPVCGGPVICGSAKDWAYRGRDRRPGPTYGHVLMFCSWPCKRKFESDYGLRKERMVLK